MTAKVRKLRKLYTVLNYLVFWAVNSNGWIFLFFFHTMQTGFLTSELQENYDLFTFYYGV